MDDKNYISALQKQCDTIESLRELDRKNPEFQRWHHTTQMICDRIDRSYGEEFKKISFSPLYSSIDGLEIGAEEGFGKGLDAAKALLLSFIDVLQTLGCRNFSEHSTPQTSPVTISISQNQSQKQSVSNQLEVPNCDDETRAKLDELLQELKKKKINRSRVAELLKWLLDKGTDALIALLSTLVGKYL